MFPYDISVILPVISDQSKLQRFCSSLFATDKKVELIICAKADEIDTSGINSEEAVNIKVLSDYDGDNNALLLALIYAKGEYIMFSDVNVVFSGKALHTMFDFSESFCMRASVCNIAKNDENGSSNVFSENFLFDELGSVPIYYNHLLSSEIIKKNNLCPVDSSPFSIMNFLADYYRFDNYTQVNNTLLYTDRIITKEITDDQWDISEKYAAALAEFDNNAIRQFLLRHIISSYINSESSLQEKNYIHFKNCMSAFLNDYISLSWIKSTYNIDITLICGEKSQYSDFKYKSDNIWYKEVAKPVNANDIVMDFYAGKLSFAVLKRCIGAWIYYKFYRKNDGITKKIGCKIGRHLLGGDFNE